MYWEEVALMTMYDFMEAFLLPRGEPREFGVQGEADGRWPCLGVQEEVQEFGYNMR